MTDEWSAIFRCLPSTPFSSHGPFPTNSLREGWANSTSPAGKKPCSCGPCGPKKPLKIYMSEHTTPRRTSWVRCAAGQHLGTVSAITGTERHRAFLMLYYSLIENRIGHSDHRYTTD